MLFGSSYHFKSFQIAYEIFALYISLRIVISLKKLVPDYKQIRDEPPLKNEILQAVNDGKLIIFIGAGVSRIEKVPGWRKLAFSLIDECSTVKDKEGNHIINFKIRESLKKDPDSKKIITICRNALKEVGQLEKFNDLIIKQLSVEEPTHEIYDIIYSIPATFLTTNADKLSFGNFNQNYIADNIKDPTQFHSDYINKYKLYFLHGNINSPNNLVFDVSKYIDRYNQPEFRNFLQTIFKTDYVVLFLGYGLSELEILDHLITNSSGKTDKKHFFVKGFFSGQEDLVSFESYYFKDLGIELIPYNLDNKGYEQLVDVLKKWKLEIEETSIITHNNFELLTKAAHARPNV